jgi:hypothetical protein
MLVTVFQHPNGEQVELNMSNIYSEDEAYFADNNVRISFEDIGEMYAVYAFCDGMEDEEDEEELLVLSQGRSCEETLKELRKECENYFSKSKED